MILISLRVFQTSFRSSTPLRFIPNCQVGPLLCVPLLGYVLVKKKLSFGGKVLMVL